MEITCCKCGYTWDYKGKSFHWATCPTCHIKNTVFIEENLKYAEVSKCIHCGHEFYKKRKRSHYCSPDCQRMAAAIKGGKAAREKCNFKGENNPNWKGGISKDHYRYKKIQMERYPERVKARDILNKAIRAGKIKRPKICPRCKKKRMVHAHHKDYSKPLDVEWYCRPCHREIHGGTNKKNANYL